MLNEYRSVTTRSTRTRKRGFQIVYLVPCFILDEPIFELNIPLVQDAGWAVDRHRRFRLIPVAQEAHLPLPRRNWTPGVDRHQHLHLPLHVACHCNRFGSRLLIRRRPTCTCHSTLHPITTLLCTSSRMIALPYTCHSTLHTFATSSSRTVISYVSSLHVPLHAAYGCNRPIIWLSSAINRSIDKPFSRNLGFAPNIGRVANGTHSCCLADGPRHA